MTPEWRWIVGAVLAAWVGALVLGLAALALLDRRLGRDRAWPAARVVAPLLDLLGTWAGAIAAAGLLLGRRGFGPAWALALGLVALTVTASLYDRAVLIPSLDAARRRLAADPETPRWAADHAFLARMAVLARALTLAGTAGALAAVLLA